MLRLHGGECAKTWRIFASPRFPSLSKCKSAGTFVTLCVLAYWIGIACRNVEALFRPLPVDSKEEKAIPWGIRQNIGLGDAVSSHSSGNLLERDESYSVDDRYPTSRTAFRLKHCKVFLISFLSHVCNGIMPFSPVRLTQEQTAISINEAKEGLTIFPPHGETGKDGDAIRCHDWGAWLWWRSQILAQQKERDQNSMFRRCEYLPMVRL